MHLFLYFDITRGSAFIWKLYARCRKSKLEQIVNAKTRSLAKRALGLLLWQLHQSSPYRQMSILFLMTYRGEVKCTVRRNFKLITHAKNHDNSMENARSFVCFHVCNKKKILCEWLYDRLSNAKIWCFWTRPWSAIFNNGHVPSISSNHDGIMA